jgi:AhpC/TSA family
VQIIGVAWSGSEKSFQGFVAKHKLSFTNLSDDKGNVYSHFGVPGQPAWVFVDSSGKVTRALGVLSDAKLESIVNGLS